MFSALKFPAEYAADLKALELLPSATLKDVKSVYNSDSTLATTNQEIFNRLEAYKFSLELGESKRISQFVTNQSELIIADNFNKIKNTLLMIKAEAELESYFPSVLASIVIAYLEITLADYITKTKDLFYYIEEFSESSLLNAHELLDLDQTIPLNLGAHSLHELRLDFVRNQEIYSKLDSLYFNQFPHIHERKIPEKLVYDIFDKIQTGSIQLLDLLEIFSPFDSLYSLKHLENFFISKLPKTISVADGDKLLLSAVQAGYLKAVQHIDMRYGHTISKNLDSPPLLHVAVAFLADNPNMLATLLEMKADVNLKYPEFEQIPGFYKRYVNENSVTALHLATYGEALKNVELLLERKAQFDIPDDRKTTALQLAVKVSDRRTENNEIFHLFLKYDTGPLFEKFKCLHNEHSSKLTIYKKNSMRYRLFHNEINNMREVVEHIEKEPTSKKSKEVIEMLKARIAGPSV